MATEILAFVGLVHRLQARHYGRIRECRRVTHSTAFRDIAEQSPHNFSGPCLGQIGGKDDELRLRDRPDFCSDVIADLRQQLVSPIETILQGDEGSDGLTLYLVALPHHRGLGNGGMVDKGTFHFHRPNSMPRRH